MKKRRLSINESLEFRPQHDAKRQIENLNQNDQIIALLAAIDSKLDWMARHMHDRDQRQD